MQILTTNLFGIKNKAAKVLVNCAISFSITTLFIILVRFAAIPNPNLFLMMGLVIITVLFGFVPGIIPAAAMIVYSFWFFSDNNDFVTFSQINSTKVWVAIITGLMSYAFVGLINLFYDRNTMKLIESVSDLHQMNNELRMISKTDALTRIKNRYSLKHDLQYYVNEDIQVMIFDIDDFKKYNDTYGHQFGDIILSEVSRITKELFEEENVYRYGGDEFIVIKTQLALSEFEALLKEYENSVHSIRIVDKDIRINLSIGYTYGVPGNTEELRQMINKADMLMYEVKRSKKNDHLGMRFGID